MKLYWGPHTCAIGIHILLEESGLPYETEQIDVQGGAAQKPPFLAINPKGKVPTLIRDDGSVLTEFGAIAVWIARASPAKNLLPQDPDVEARAIEVTDYVQATIHGQGFGRLFKPAKFEPQDLVHGTLGLGQSSVKEQGRRMVEAGFHILDAHLGFHAFAAGDDFTIADAALFYVERWAPGLDITLPPNVERHYQAMRTRPAVCRVLGIWGER